MKNNLKIVAMLACLMGVNLHSSTCSDSGGSDTPGTPMTPVTPHGLLKKLSSSFRLTPPQTWQQEVAQMVASKGLRCTSLDKKHLTIAGTFTVDERSWTVLSGKNMEAKFPWGPVIKDWIFSINVEQIANNKYFVTIVNPEIAYARKSREAFNVEAKNLLHSISQLLRVLDPRSSMYSE